ncbi:MAG: DndE family protein [Candidatus Competibacteraceae bacterium]|nr:MAG: DndE family protein [Candidatus Competibacteraceae bacterium]
MADRLMTSMAADEVLNALRLETKLDKAVLARLACCLSLALDGKDVPPSVNFSGGEIRRSSFLGSDGPVIQALIAHAHERPDIPDEEWFSNRSIVKNHIDRGCAHLEQWFNECGCDAGSLIERLLEAVEFEGRRELMGRELELLIGRTALENQNVIVELNNTARHANSHLAIMGKPGVGKTQFLLKILTDIRIQSNFQTHFIYFDYKGDVVGNPRFLDLAKVQPYRLLQSGQNLPINPFVLPTYDEQTINVSAREKAESFASISAKLGVVQKGALTEAIRAGYAQRAETDMPYPDLQDILAIADRMYEDQGKSADSLIEILRDLSTFNLFWKHGDETAPLERLTNRTLLIDLHAMPVLKELVAYLVIERLYKEMTVLPDSPVENSRRTIRTILVIDEAHNYLNQKNLFLERIIREGRSKGVVVFFASQSPNDYQQKFFNFQELLEFAYLFQCDGVSASAIQDILGCSSKTAKDLQVEVARLGPWQVISRSQDRIEGFVKFAAEAFYKSYG